VNTETVIYRQAYRYRDRSFEVWSYLDDPDPARSSLLFAFQAEGETVGSFCDRTDAIGEARERIGKRPLSRVKQRQRQTQRLGQGQQPPPSEIAQLREGAPTPTRPAQRTLFAP
jgi:hypothetical protein